MSFFNKNENAVATQPATRTITPRYEIKETTDAFVITALVPGVDRAGIETQVHGDTLSVVARRTWNAPEGWTAVYRETPVGDYRLVLELDNRFDREKVRAELTQGVLTLTLPKAEAAKPRRIEIQG